MTWNLKVTAMVWARLSSRPALHLCCRTPLGMLPKDHSSRGQAVGRGPEVLGVLRNLNSCGGAAAGYRLSPCPRDLGSQQ